MPLARLLANLPLLWAGHLPLMIRKEDRQTYIQVLAWRQMDIGPATPHCDAWLAENPAFRRFCREQYAATEALLREAEAVQASRNRSREA